jgi:hypothetical protein
MDSSVEQCGRFGCRCVDGPRPIHTLEDYIANDTHIRHVSGCLRIWIVFLVDSVRRKTTLVLLESKGTSSERQQRIQRMQQGLLLDLRA